MVLSVRCSQPVGERETCLEEQKDKSPAVHATGSSSRLCQIKASSLFDELIEALLRNSDYLKSFSLTSRSHGTNRPAACEYWTRVLSTVGIKLLKAPFDRPFDCRGCLSCTLYLRTLTLIAYHCLQNKVVIFMAKYFATRLHLAHGVAIALGLAASVWKPLPYFW